MYNESILQIPCTIFHPAEDIRLSWPSAVCALSVGFSLTEDEAQAALLGDVSQRCCYGNTPAKEMDIYQIISSCALHVSLLIYLVI